MATIINIYQRHIDRGFNGRGAQLVCPIAIAMTEELGVKVGIWGGKAWDMETGDSYDLPEDVTKRYIKYDHSGFMKPFSFEIEIRHAELARTIGA